METEYFALQSESTYRGHMVEDHSSARQLAAHVSAVRAETRSRVFGESWHWFPVWALVCFGAAVSALGPWSDHVAGYYWLVAVPIGLAVTAGVSWRLDAGEEIGTREWPYWAVGGGIFLANTLLASWLPENVVPVAIWVVLGVGFAALCQLGRNVVGRNVMLAMAVVTFVTGWVGQDGYALYPVLAIGYGLALIGMSLHAHRAERAGRGR